LRTNLTRLRCSGFANWWRGMQLGCYCHECGQCTHVGTYRFPARYLNSCENCLTCPNSGRLLWGDYYGVEKSSANFRIGRWYKFRTLLSYSVHGLACRIDPNDGAARKLSRPQAAQGVEKGVE